MQSIQIDLDLNVFFRVYFSFLICLEQRHRGWVVNSKTSLSTNSVRPTVAYHQSDNIHPLATYNNSATDDFENISAKNYSKVIVSSLNGIENIV